jgi:hypothetical protein
MRRVLAARIAKLFCLQPVGVLLLVLCCGVIPVLALTALQRNDFPHSLNSFSLECKPAWLARSCFV